MNIRMLLLELMDSQACSQERMSNCHKKSLKGNMAYQFNFFSMCMCVCVNIIQYISIKVTSFPAYIIIMFFSNL